MKIYKVLKDVTPILKTGTVKEMSLKKNFSKTAIIFLLIERYIEEIRESEWTDDDMRDYAIYCQSVPIGKPYSVEMWKKQK